MRMTVESISLSTSTKVWDLSRIGAFKEEFGSDSKDTMWMLAGLAAVRCQSLGHLFTHSSPLHLIL